MLSTAVTQLVKSPIVKSSIKTLTPVASYAFTKLTQRFKNASMNFLKQQNNESNFFTTQGKKYLSNLMNLKNSEPQVFKNYQPNLMTYQNSHPQVFTNEGKNYSSNLISYSNTQPQPFTNEGQYTSSNYQNSQSQALTNEGKIFSPNSMSHQNSEPQITNERENQPPKSLINQNSESISYSSEGKNQFIKKVYMTTSLSVLGVLSTSQLATYSSFLMTNPLFTLCTGTGMLILGLYQANIMKPKNTTELINDQVAYKTENTKVRVGLYGMGLAGLGLTSSLLFASVNATNPFIIPMSIGVSAIVFGTTSLYAHFKPNDFFLNNQTALYTTFATLAALQLLGLGSYLYLGSNMFSLMCHRVDLFAGIGLFTALTAHDLQYALNKYNEGNADHLGTSIHLLLNSWQTFIRILEMLHRNKK